MRRMEEAEGVAHRDPALHHGFMRRNPHRADQPPRPPEHSPAQVARKVAACHGPVVRLPETSEENPPRQRLAQDMVVVIVDRGPVIRHGAAAWPCRHLRAQRL